MQHDSLRRVLFGDWSGKKRLESITNPKKLRGGTLIIDDTPLEKPYGKEYEDAGYFFSSSLGKAVYGYQLVLLIWVKGKKRIVIDQRIYCPGKSRSKIAIALEMLSYARNKLCIKPEVVLFDSWYCAKMILKRISDYGWCFVSQIKKNRLFNGKKLKKYKTNPYWNESGWLKGGLRVRIVRNGKKYFITNRLSLGRSQILDLYKRRQNIEEVNKELKFQGLNDCQTRNIKAHSQFIWICIIAFSIIEQKSRVEGYTVYHFKKINRSSDELLPRALQKRILRDA